MKGIIIYKSNYGSTEQYARWIQEETGFDCVELKKAKARDLGSSDRIVLGCPIYAGNPLMAKWINRQWPLLREKKVILFTTSGAPAGDPALARGYEKALGPEIRDAIGYFPLGGRMVFAELKPLMRFIMNMAKKAIKDPAEREAMTADFDRMDRSSLKPLLASLT